MTTLQLPKAFRELTEPARHKAFYGGRGSAKSHSFAQMLVLAGYQRRDFRWLCTREIQNSLAASVKRLLEDKIQLSGLGPASQGGNGFYRMTERTITGGDGRCEFLFAGLRHNPESIKSMENLDGAWVEEAQQASKRSIDLLTPTVRKDGSEIWYSWNRLSEKDHVDAMFLAGEPPPRSVIRKVSWRDNPFFPNVLVEEMAWDKRRDHEKWLHVWEGEPLTHSEAKVFKNWRVDDIDLEVPEGCVPRLGADWGFANDPTVLVECLVWDRTLYFRREAWKLKLEIDDTPALFAGFDSHCPPRWANRLGFPGIEAARRYKIIADSARPETISYMKKRGFDMAASRKGQGSVVEGVEFMKSFDIVVHPSCQHVADELTHYSYKQDELTEEILPVFADKKNHTIDACRYALENVRRAFKRPLGAVPQLVAMED